MDTFLNISAAHPNDTLCNEMETALMVIREILLEPVGNDLYIDNQSIKSGEYSRTEARCAR